MNFFEELFQRVDIDEHSEEQFIDYAVAVNELVEYIRATYKPDIPEFFEIRPEYLIAGETDSPLSELIKSLREAQVTPEGVINANLGILHSDFRTITIRKCYIDLAKILLEAKGDYMKHIILGSTGTGITVFCVFIMFLLLKANESGGNFPFFFNLRGHVGMYHKGRLTCIDPRFLSIGTMVKRCQGLYFLYDDIPPPPTIFPFANTVVFSSPNEQRYKEFQKGKCRKLYIPLWSKGELMRLNNNLSQKKKFSEAELDERIMLSGGVPRRIFDEWERIDEFVANGLVKVTLEMLKEASAFYFEIDSRSLIGIDVSSNYQHFRCRFLTKELRRCIFAHLKEYAPDSIAYALQNTHVFEQPRMLFYDLFEVFAIENICLRKEHNLLPLNAEAREFCQLEKLWSLKAPSVEQRKIKNIDDVVLDTELPIIWVPNNAFPFVDALLTLPGKTSNGGTLVIGLKMTMNLNHLLDNDKLKKLTDRFGNNFILASSLVLALKNSRKDIKLLNARKRPDRKWRIQKEWKWKS